MVLFFACDEPLPVKSLVKSADVGGRGNKSLVTENLVRQEVLNFDRIFRYNGSLFMAILRKNQYYS